MSREFTNHMRELFTKVLILGFLTVWSASALSSENESPEAELTDIERGRILYGKNCKYCHGENGDGKGPVAFFLNIQPRDFRAPRNLTTGIFKFKSSSYNELFPFDRDLYETINQGLGGSAMPGLRSNTSLADIRGVIAYIKTFSEEWEEPFEGVDYSGRVVPSPESFTKGRELFLDNCAECHGGDLTGASSKKLKDDWGRDIDPRNLNKPYEFRKGNTPQEIYTRVTAGIYGTPMQSFADPRNEKRLSNEERWHIANYVSSITTRTPPLSR